MAGIQSGLSVVAGSLAGLSVVASITKGNLWWQVVRQGCLYVVSGNLVGVYSM